MSKAVSPRDRKRAERDRKRKAGLVKLEFWVPKGKTEKVKAAVERALR